MRGAAVFVAIVCLVCATACSTTSSREASAQHEVYLSDLPADGNPSFKPGDGVIGGTRYPRSFLWSCEGCLPVGKAGQQGQPAMEFNVPDGFNRLQFVSGLTDSSTETDRSAYVGVWAEKADQLTKLFESSTVTASVGTPVSVSVSPGDKIRIDGGHLNGNETLCICDPKLVA